MELVLLLVEGIGMMVSTRIRKPSPRGLYLYCTKDLGSRQRLYMENADRVHCNGYHIINVHTNSIGLRS